MANLADRTYTFEISFGGEQIEHVPGGMVVHGARMQFRKREYRHTNPTRRKRTTVAQRTMKDVRKAMF